MPSAVVTSDMSRISEPNIIDALTQGPEHRGSVTQGLWDTSCYGCT